MDWDDLKLLLALARRGSARGAAVELGVSTSTIGRRLDSFERALGSRLFDRTPDGYRMTAAAEALLPTAEQVEEEILAAERRITGGDRELRGSIRLTLPPAASLGRLMTCLARFASEYPGIELELLPAEGSLDLARREADMAIRVVPAGTRLPDYLIGRRLSALSLSTYVHRSLIDPGEPGRVDHLDWIGKIPLGEAQDWLAATPYRDRPVRHAIDDHDLLVAALRCRMGMAYIPCIAVADEPDIVRVPGAPVTYHGDVWILTHRDLRLSARLRVLREAIAEAVAEIRPLLDTRDRG